MWVSSLSVSLKPTTHSRMHKSNQAAHLLHLPFMCSSPLLATLRQVGTERIRSWKKGCRQHVYTAVLWLSNCPWRVWGGSKLQPLLCFWVRGVDRHESGQQGCSTESGWRYAGAFRHPEREVDGKRFPFTQKPRSGLTLRRNIVLLGWYLSVPKGSFPAHAPKWAWQKTQSFSG